MTFNQKLSNLGVAIGSVIGYVTIAIGVTMAFLLLKTILISE